jgi:drug/metabolite transporter (DMT)-like permease
MVYLVRWDGDQSVPEDRRWPVSGEPTMDVAVGYGRLVDPKLLALITAVTFGLTPVILKTGFRRGGSTTAAMIIGLVVAVPITSLPALWIGVDVARLTPLAVGAFVLGGLAGNAVGRRWNFQAIDLLGPSRASAIRASSPVVTTLLAAILYAEPVTPARWTAVLAIVAGVALVTWQPGESRRSWLGIGVAYAFLGAISYGIRPLIIKFGLEEANLPAAAAVIGAVAALVYTVLSEDRRRLRSVHQDAAFGPFLVAGILVAAGLTTLTFGLSAGDVSIVYPLVASAPLFTLVFTALLLKGVELLNWRIVLGAVAVVVGVIYLQ